MPIYDLTYRGYRGERAKSPSFLPVVENTIRLALRNKILRSIYYAAGAPVVVAIVFLYVRYQIEASVMAQRGRSSMRLPFAFEIENYYWFLFSQGMLALVLAAVVGASAIGGDRRGNALEAIFSRPITLTQYLIGRWLGLFTLVLAATLVPGFLLWCFDNAFSLDPDRLVKTLSYPCRIAAWAVVQGASVSLLVLAFSALISRAGIAMATFAAFFFLSSAFTNGVAAAVERVSEPTAEIIRSFGFVEAHRAVQLLIFGVAKRDVHLEVNPTSSCIVLSALALFCIWVLYRRVRPIEVVS